MGAAGGQGVIYRGIPPCRFPVQNEDAQRSQTQSLLPLLLVLGGGRKIVTCNKWGGKGSGKLYFTIFLALKNLGGREVKNITFDMERGNLHFSTPPPKFCSYLARFGKNILEGYNFYVGVVLKPMQDF